MVVRPFGPSSAIHFRNAVLSEALLVFGDLGNAMYTIVFSLLRRPLLQGIKKGRGWVTASLYWHFPTQYSAYFALRVKFSMAKT